MSHRFPTLHPRLAGLAAILIGCCGLSLAAPGPADAVVYFHSPSGNIGCGLFAGGARCDVREHSWRPPTKPNGCRQDWGYGLTLGERGEGRFFCAGDSVLGIGSRLAYGRSIRRGRFVCVSRSDGMRCVNGRNKHGFKLSREHANRF